MRLTQIHAVLQQMARLREVADGARLTWLSNTPGGLPAPGLLSQTGMEPATRDSVQLLLELPSRANTDYPLSLSKTCSVSLDSSRDCR